MEEASVAGESPDRSKQRASSAEPTSGSANPVPGTGDGSPEVRDPRLALSGRSGSPADSGGRGGVDTATRVLSVRDVKTEDDARTEAGGDALSAGADTEDASDASGASDARDSEGAGTPAGAGDADRADRVERVEKAGEAGRSGEGATAASDAEDSEGEEDSDGAKDGEAGDDSASGSGSDSGSGSGDADGSDSAGDARLRAAVAAWVGSAGEKKGSEEPVGAGASEKAAEGPEEAEDGPGGPAEPQDATGPRHDAQNAQDAEDAEGAEGTRDAEGAKATEGDDDEPQDAPADEPSADEPPAAEDTRAADDAGTGVDPRPPVDQPTTMLKLGDAKPRVDQPTTMLKLGGNRKPEPGPQSDAERTSKFVALKPLDAPETRKPQPKAEPRPDAQPQPQPQPRPKAEPRPKTEPQPKTGPAGPAQPTGPAQPAGPAVPADATRPVPRLGPERTTQQPLPPKPPLDLLAELTNTPPPPETPLRTLVRRVKIWTPLVVLLAIVFAIVQAVRPLPAPTLALTAEDSYTFDGSRPALPWPAEGQGWMDVNGIGTMGNFGKQTPVAIGSVAKTMTAYIVLRDHPLKPGEEGPKIQVDATAEKEGGYDKDGESTLNTVKAGDVLTEKQALSAIMVPSANNIARLLARWDAGSEAAFVKKMNATARELGMTGTTYTDPSGLKETTVSTAHDQVKLGNAVVRMPALVAITSAPSWTDPSGHKWSNYNRLVPYNGAIGIKTGTTTAAGGNLLFAAHKQVGGQTVTVVGAILGQHRPPIIDTVNAVSKTAMLAAQEAMTSAKILKKGDVVGYVDDRLGGHTPVVVTQDVSAVGWAGLRVKLSFAADDVPHTAKAGTRVGTLTVGDGSGGAVRVPVALQKDLAEPGFGAKLTRVG
ncbi:D-alanyl-D-alanine carboxypeptidase [Streptomyces sp. NPDC003374]